MKLLNDHSLIFLGFSSCWGILWDAHLWSILELLLHVFLFFEAIPRHSVYGISTYIGVVEMGSMYVNMPVPWSVWEVYIPVDPRQTTIRNQGFGSVYGFSLWNHWLPATSWFAWIPWVLRSSAPASAPRVVHPPRCNARSARSTTPSCARAAPGLVVASAGVGGLVSESAWVRFGRGRQVW